MTPQELSEIRRALEDIQYVPEKYLRDAIIAAIPTEKEVIISPKNHTFGFPANQEYLVYENEYNATEFCISLLEELDTTGEKTWDVANVYTVKAFDLVCGDWEKWLTVRMEEKDFADFSADWLDEDKNLVLSEVDDYRDPFIAEWGGFFDDEFLEMLK